MLVEKAVISNSRTSIPRLKVSKPHFLRQASFVANWRTCYNQNRRARLNVELLSHSGSLRSFGGTRSVVNVRTSSKVKFPNADFVVNFVTTTRCLTSGPLEYRCTNRQNGSARFSRRKVNSKYWNLRLFFFMHFLHSPYPVKSTADGSRYIGNFLFLLFFEIKRSWEILLLSLTFEKVDKTFVRT